MRRFEVKLDGRRGWYIQDADDYWLYLNRNGALSNAAVDRYFPSENAAKHFLTDWLAKQARIGDKPHVMEALNTLQAYMRESGYGRATISANGGAAFELEA